MTLADLLQLAASRSDAWFDLWHLYIPMTSAVVILVSASSVPVSRPIAAALCSLILLAAIGFAPAFWSAYDVQIEIAKAIATMASDGSTPHASLAKKISAPLEPDFPKWSWALSYILYTAIVTALTWLIPEHRRGTKERNGERQ